MPIPANIKIENGPLPPRPGVYVFRGEKGRLLYIGKATSLKTRVNSHFVRPFNGRIAKMTTEVRRGLDLAGETVADHVIDLGPEGGEGGGRVVATGTPEEIAKYSDTHTARYLKRALGIAPKPPKGGLTGNVEGKG